MSNDYSSRRHSTRAAPAARADGDHRSLCGSGVIDATLVLDPVLKTFIDEVIVPALVSLLLQADARGEGRGDPPTAP